MMDDDGGYTDWCYELERDRRILSTAEFGEESTKRLRGKRQATEEERR